MKGNQTLSCGLPLEVFGQGWHLCHLHSISDARRRSRSTPARPQERIKSCSRATRRISLVEKQGPVSVLRHGGHGWVLVSDDRRNSAKREHSA